MASPPLVYTCIPLVVHLNIGFFLPAEGNCGPISVLLITVARVSLGMKPGCSARVFDPSPRCATLFTWTMLVHVQTSDRLPELASLTRAQSSSDRQIQRPFTPYLLLPNSCQARDRNMYFQQYSQNQTCFVYFLYTSIDSSGLFYRKGMGLNGKKGKKKRSKRKQ